MGNIMRFGKANELFHFITKHYWINISYLNGIELPMQDEEIVQTSIEIDINPNGYIIDS
jgi:hypothetical protein